MAKILKLPLLILVTLCLNGCWDKVEIEERDYISVLGIDVFKEEGASEDKEDTIGKIDVPEESLRNTYTVTYVFPNLSGIGKNAQRDVRRFVISSVGPNTFQTTRQLSTRLNRQLFFKHLKTVIVGEDFARNPDYMKENLDALDRHDQISRKVYFMISEGTAKETLKIETEVESITSAGLHQVALTGNTARYNPLTLDDILVQLHGNGSALIPRIIPGKKEIKIAGSAVIKDYRLIGWLGEQENRAVMFLADQIKGSIVDVPYKDVSIPYIITDSFTKKSVDLGGDALKALESIEMEGYMQKYEIGTETTILEENVIKAIEEEVEKELKREIEVTLNKLQKEFKVDVIGMGDYLRKFKPDLWETIEKDWEEIFPDLDVSIKIDAKLRRVGMTR